MTGSLRERLTQRSVLAGLVLTGLLLVAALVLPRLPHPVAGMGTLDQCLGGWPVLRFEGEDWKDALPGELRAHPPPYVPIAEWPSGMQFDERGGVLIDADGDTVFRKADRVRINGSVIEVHGDPSPCYYTVGLKVEEIAGP
jgi:hypothetical protein